MYSHNLAFPRIQVESLTVVRHTYLCDEQNDLLNSLVEFSRPVLSFPSSMVHSPSGPGRGRRLAFWCLEFLTYLFRPVPLHPPRPNFFSSFFLSLGLTVYIVHTATTVTGKVICIGREAHNIIFSV